MKITCLLTASAFLLTAWAAPASAEPGQDTTSLTACGDKDKDDEAEDRRKRRGEQKSSDLQLAACGDKDKDDADKRRKRRGEQKSSDIELAACGDKDKDDADKRRKRRGEEKATVL